MLPSIGKHYIVAATVLYLTDIEECASLPCQNFGECSEELPGSYECECLSGYSGDTCEIGGYIYWFCTGFDGIKISSQFILL